MHRYKRILVIVSHSQDFMNGVCTNVIHMTQKKLLYYGVSGGCLHTHTPARTCLQGNYDQFIKTQIEQMENNAKRYNWEQNQLQHMKVRCTHVHTQQM